MEWGGWSLNYHRTTCFAYYPYHTYKYTPPSCTVCHNSRAPSPYTVTIHHALPCTTQCRMSTHHWSAWYVAMKCDLHSSSYDMRYIIPPKSGSCNLCTSVNVLLEGKTSTMQSKLQVMTSIWVQVMEETMPPVHACCMERTTNRSRMQQSNAGTHTGKIWTQAVFLRKVHWHLPHLLYRSADTDSVSFDDTRHSTWPETLTDFSHSTATLVYIGARHSSAIPPAECCI